MCTVEEAAVMHMQAKEGEAVMHMQANEWGNNAHVSKGRVSNRRAIDTQADQPWARRRQQTGGEC